MNRNSLQTVLKHKTDLALGLIIFGLSFFIYYLSPVYAFSDSKYTLVLSESLVKHRSFTLDRLALTRLPRKDNGNYVSNGRDYQLEWVGERLYLYMPPGSSVLSAPYIASANAFGIYTINGDGSYNLANEIRLQLLLAALLMAVLAGIFYFTSRLLLPRFWSIIIAIGAAFGTQVWSTMSRGLWSDTWGVLLLGAVIWILLAAATNQVRLRPEILATVLAWTYFVRPTNAISITAIAVYIFVYHRREFLRFTIAGFAWMAIFVFYSWYHFGKVLPSYYRASRLTFEHFSEALAGNLISPARGLFVYVPVLLFIFFLLIRYRKQIVFLRLVGLSFAIIVIHWIVTSGFPHWWGGFSYGPRLMGSVVPWFVLLGVVGLSAMLKARAERDKTQPAFGIWRLQNAGGALLLLVSIFMNGVGPTMAATETWNERPTSIDLQKSRLWDWTYPQFLAGFLLPPLPDVFPPADVRVNFTRPSAEPYLWYGWGIDEERFRWADARKATVIFSVREITDARLHMKIAPLIIPKKVEQQTVHLRLNDHWLDTMTLKEPSSLEYSRLLPRELLKQNNVLTFEFPDARSPKSMGVNDDTRLLSMAVVWLEVQTGVSRDTGNNETRSMAEDPLPEGGYAAEVEVLDPPPDLLPGVPADVKVRVRNISSSSWPAQAQPDGTFKVQLGNHWTDANGRMLVMDDAREPLPFDLQPGRSVELTLTVHTPNTPGDYILLVDMVQERVKWFQDDKNSRPARVKVTVSY
jgi:hypothetical protein